MKTLKCYKGIRPAYSDLPLWQAHLAMVVTMTQHMQARCQAERRRPAIQISLISSPSLLWGLPWPDPLSRQETSSYITSADTGFLTARTIKVNRSLISVPMMSATRPCPRGLKTPRCRAAVPHVTLTSCQAKEQSVRTLCRTAGQSRT